MDKMSLDNIKNTQINILKEVSKFCDENDINYFLSGGTLLGAVRHKGYIPWDDDIDIMMPRPDYNKFLKLFNGSNKFFRVISSDLDEMFPFTFAKVEDIRTSLIEDTLLNYPIGINIDVFPLDGFPQDKNESDKFIKRIKLLRGLYTIKSIKNKRDRKFFKKLTLFLSKIFLKLINIEKIVKKIVMLSQEYEYDSSSYVGCVVWGYGEKEIMDKSIFEKSIDIEFENNFYKAPIGYEIYLKSLYGDYMKLPPEEKRISHHSYNAYLKK